jgi:uncharacterized membrane protein (UPF0127 family)
MKKFSFLIKIIIKLIIINCFINYECYAISENNLDNLNASSKHYSNHSKSDSTNIISDKIDDNNNNQTNQELITIHKKNFNQNFDNYQYPLKIVDDHDKTLMAIKVAIAKTNEQRAFGLMYLKKLPIDKGMIFIFDQMDVLNFWMKNTFIPLDILFIDQNHQIIKIKENCQPLNESIISSDAKAINAIEINAGLVKKHNIKIGNKIIFDKL